MFWNNACIGDAIINMRIILLLAILSVILFSPAHASEESSVPRFVTIKSDKANIRTGPGKRYPIKWEITRGGIPVEVVSEFEQWRKVRDFQGEGGWVFHSMLSGVRAVVIQSAPQILRKSDSASSRPLAKLDVGVVARLKSCTKEWCKVEKDDLEGWVSRRSVWGVYPNEDLNR